MHTMLDHLLEPAGGGRMARPPAWIPPAAKGDGTRGPAAPEPSGELRFGRVSVTPGVSARGEKQIVKSTAALVHVVAPLRGRISAVSEDGTIEVGPGEALVLGRSERAECIWRSDGASLLFTLPRAAIQTETSRRFGEPRRLAGANIALCWAWTPPLLRGRPMPILTDTDFVDVAPRIDTKAAEAATIRSLVDTLVAELDTDAMLPVSRSVQRVLDRVGEEPGADWTMDRLAAISGVTPESLRRSFRSCLGMPVKQVIRDMRLDWVSERLRSSSESRSISQLASASGIGSAAQLNRFYQRRFGESPSRTRSRAFATRRN